MEIYNGEYVMAKRIKLNRLVAGPAVKEIYGTILSGAVIPDTEVWRDIYVAGQQGNLLTSTNLTADSTLYNVGFFEREYSVKNPDLVEHGVELGVKPTNSDIMDIIQFGNYAFNLTNETTMGTQYALETTPDISGYYLEPHELAVYPSMDDLSGQLADGSDELSGVAFTIKDITFNVTPERPDIVYGLLSGGSIIVYVKDLSANSDTVYSLSAGVPNSLPFAYLMEQPLQYSLNFGRDAFAYGGVSGFSTPFLYTPLISGNVEQSVYSPYGNDGNTFQIYYNPFKLKNMYNYNWNCEYNASTQELTAVRDYLKVGKSQGHLWLSYKYFRETVADIQEFELIERIAGLYKYQAIEGHKSNIYSIRIFNSGLNEDLKDSPEELSVQRDLRNIIEETVQNVVKKIAPTSTQLWKIEWEGR